MLFIMYVIKFLLCCLCTYLLQRTMFLVQPLIVRSVRNDLTREAERAAIEVFATNLKKLLLMPPLRGTTILGIDPGIKSSNFVFYVFLTC